MTKEELLDAKAVAVYLGLHPKTVYRAVRKKKMEAWGFRVIRINRQLRFEKLQIWRSSDGALVLRRELVYQTRLMLP